LPGRPSEPHYIWMEAGTDTFADHMFVNDDPPSAANSTASTNHLVSEIRAAGGRRDWMTYQEGLSGAGCPIAGHGTFVTRHDPFLFFRDVVGDPPAGAAPVCATHHRPLEQLDADLASGAVASYVFITPDLCHDMHGSPACPAGAGLRDRAGRRPFHRVGRGGPHVHASVHRPGPARPTRLSQRGPLQPRVHRPLRRTHPLPSGPPHRPGRRRPRRPLRRRRHALTGTSGAHGWTAVRNAGWGRVLRTSVRRTPPRRAMAMPYSRLSRSPMACASVEITNLMPRRRAAGIQAGGRSSR